MTFTFVALALGLATNPALAAASAPPTVQPAITGPVVRVDERGNPQIVSASSRPGDLARANSLASHAD